MRMCVCVRVGMVSQMVLQMLPLHAGMWYAAASSGMVMMLIGTNHATGRITTLRLCLASGHQAMEIELVGIPLAMHLRHDVLVVVVTVEKEIKKKELNWIRICKIF